MTRTSALLAAIADLERSGFGVGEAWHRAHELAQSNEGDRLFDRLHALLHRIEGDAWNAGYWYRRAGAKPFEGGFAEEAAALRALTA